TRSSMALRHSRTARSAATATTRPTASRTATTRPTTATRRTRGRGNGGASVERRGRMDAPADGSPTNGTEPPENADSLERLLALVGPRVDEVRSLLGALTFCWRRD